MILVDTSVWSLALRRDRPSSHPEVVRLTESLEVGEEVFTTGLVIQELLQGFEGPRAWQAIIERLSILPQIVPTFDDHIAAAELRNKCRRKGVQVGTIDALLAQLCIRHELALLTTDRDFERLSTLAPLRLAR